MEVLFTRMNTMMSSQVTTIEKLCTMISSFGFDLILFTVTVIIQQIDNASLGVEWEIRIHKDK
ncbi:hypothetical protein A0J61_08904 [Choanephora cucurbitarum]|uniref:Uncharacterized protein n=1 Tax=Choanephora cucurbitarum TaxID=101091 RepID=A0A1C7N329_9FUNG|nr:hypothetical protein A0J61_08904 [Choanephora cucurbitarum]